MDVSKYIKTLFLLFLFYFLSSIHIYAKPLFDAARFVAFEEESSFLLYQYSGDSNGKADNNSLEARFAFEYLFLQNNQGPEFSFSYTGEFDFYLLSRYSGPVINRISNPALHYRYKVDKEEWSTEFFTLSMIGISLEHRSNGQVTSVNKKDSSDQYLTQVALDTDDYQYFDGLSRGANYFTLKTNFRLGKDSDNKDICNNEFLCANVWLSYKLYFSSDSDITWGNLARTDTSIKDYDLFRIRAIDNFKIDFFKNQEIILEADYTIGKKYFKTDSLDVNIGVPFKVDDWKVPFFLRYHTGPMDRLSDYTKSYTTYGIGLIFTY